MSNELKVFISIPMRGRTDEEIDEERASVMEIVEKTIGPCKEVPSHFNSNMVAKLKPLECLGMSLELMSHSDVVVFAKGWEEARGCRIEHECALQYGYRIIDLSDGQMEDSL